MALADAGRYRDALDQLLVSNRLSPNPTVAFNIALCFEALQSFDEAYGTIEEYLAFHLTEEERAAGTKVLERLLPKVARLTVDTTPPGAAIFIGRRNLGQYGSTPRKLAGPTGEHDVILSLPGFHEVRRPVLLSRGQVVELDVKLEPLTGRLAITSEPAGRVTIDGSEVGDTPIDRELPIGVHRVTVARDGFVPKDDEVEVRADETARVSVSLIALPPPPPPQGRIRILTNVADGLVKVDGREAGFTPAVLELTAGPHMLEVAKPGYLEWKERLDIAVENPIAAEVTLAPANQDTGIGPMPWILFSSTLVLGAVTAALGIKALDVAGDFETTGAEDLYDRASNLAIATDVMLGATLVGAAITTTLFILESGREEQRSSASLDRLVEADAPRGDER
jgi:hypothetical protein